MINTYHSVLKSMRYENKMVEYKCLVFVLLCFFGFAYSSNVTFTCNEAFCRTHTQEETCTAPAPQCRINNSTHFGMSMPSPTICNCCDFCLPLFSEGERCSVGGTGLGTTVGRCGDGLTCQTDTSDGFSYCRRMVSKCHTAQDNYDKRHAAGQLGAMEHRPLCDGKGKYAAFDCIPAQTCFCQSEDGERIFGEVLNMGSATLQNMHCGCSRMHESIAKSISPSVPFPVIGLRCTSDGYFNPIQCLNRTCYCVDRSTGKILEGEGRKIDLDVMPIANLSCYDSALDLFPENSIGEPPYDYSTTCLNEVQNQIDYISDSEKQGFIVDYFTSVSGCMPDGTFGRIVRTRNLTKICVDEWNKQIENYSADPNTPEFEAMNCKCAQTSRLMATAIEKPVCCKNGNFRPIQCRRGLCRCVDSDGRQTERESSNVYSLSCYTNDWRNC